jgi:hypothetical protein
VVSVNRRAAAIGAVLLLVSSVLAPALAAPTVAQQSPGRSDAVVEGSPDVAISLSDNRVQPGESATLQLSITNTGEIENGSRNPEAEGVVTTARGLSVEPRSGDGPLEVRTGETAVGSLPDGASAQIPVRVQVEEGAAPGRYTLPVIVEYRYVEEYNESTGERETETVRERRTVAVEVEAAADFAVESVDSSVGVGDTGPVTLTLENTGSEDVRRASVTVQSSTGEIRFSEAEATSVYVGDWAAGETREVTVDATVAQSADQRPYAVDLTVDYTDPDGRRGQSAPLTAGITPGADQSFALEETNGTLRVGEEGTLTGTLVNDGPSDVENAVLVLQSPSRTITATDGEYALGSLSAGERTNFSFDVDVSDDAGAGPRQFTYRVRYEADGDERQSEPLYARYRVTPSRAAFAVDPVETDVTVGETGEIRLRLTNTGDERVTAVSAKLFGADPVSVDDDEAFVDALDPGESANVTFRASVAADALSKSYPVSVDFQYEDGDGDVRLSDTYRIPVRATESGDGGPLSIGWLGVAAVVALALVGGYVVLSRR